MPEPNQPRQAPREGERFVGTVTIEVGDDRNRSFQWGPTKEVLRGRWDRSNLTGDEMVDVLNIMPAIPGICVRVDGRQRRLRIYDPLAEPAHEELLRQLQEVMREEFRVKEVRPRRETVIKDASDTQVKTYLHWMRRLVDGSPMDQGTRRPRGGPQARVIEGELPTLEELARLPGHVEGEFHNSSARAIRNLEVARAQLMGLTQ